MLFKGQLNSEQGTLLDASPGVHTESETTEVTEQKQRQPRGKKDIKMFLWRLQSNEEDRI